MMDNYKTNLIIHKEDLSHRTQMHSRYPGKFLEKQFA